VADIRRSGIVETRRVRNKPPGLDLGVAMATTVSSGWPGCKASRKCCAPITYSRGGILVPGLNESAKACDRHGAYSEALASAPGCSLNEGLELLPPIRSRPSCRGGFIGTLNKGPNELPGNARLDRRTGRTESR
jgi:hypothetical protein